MNKPVIPGEIRPFSDGKAQYSSIFSGDGVAGKVEPGIRNFFPKDRIGVERWSQRVD